MDDAKKKIYKKSLQVSEEMMQVLEKLDQIVSCQKAQTTPLLPLGLLV